MKKLKISLIAIALIIGGVQAYGGLRFSTYYCQPGTQIGANFYVVAGSSPALGCLGGISFTNICTFSTAGTYSVGMPIASSACSVLSTYED